VRFIGIVERGQGHNVSITDVARIAIGLNRHITDLVSQVDELSRKFEVK
jgi:hypothetical protein